MTDAARFAEASVQEARGDRAQARARIARGAIRAYSGDGPRAAQDARAALALLDAAARPYDYSSALSLLVFALTLGTHEERDEAARYLRELRAVLPVRTPEFRARLWWSEALLLVPNRRRRARATKLLDRARRTFLRLGMRAEAVALTAELARLDPEGPVPTHCAEVLPLLEPGPIQGLVERLERVHMTGRVDLAIELRGALTGAPALGV